MLSVDKAIQEAIARGEFDGLPGQGKPIDLQAYFLAPPELRLAFSLLRNAGFTPAEVELKKVLETLTARLDAASSDAERARLKPQIQAKRLEYDLLIERGRRFGRR